MTLVTSIDIFVRSTDMDADLIVNNARYFEFFEQGRLEFMLDIGILREGDDSRTFTIAETTCRYLAPSRHRDILTVNTRLTRLGNRSFDLGYEIVNKKSGQKVAEGSSVQVWLDSQGKPTPFPSEIRKALEEAL